MDLDLDLLTRLLAAPGPSSFESRPAAVFREAAQGYGLDTQRDAYGSVFAIAARGAGPRLLLSGHIDEIGLLITHVDDQGFAWFQGIGGWDPLHLIGQRVRIVGLAGDVIGLVGRKPIHLMSAEDRRKVPKLEDLCLDIGANDKEDALQSIRPGDVAVVEQPLVQLRNGRLASKAIDDRIGAYVALQTARRSLGGATEVIASATVQEEIGGVGAAAASYALEPDVAIAIDVTHATDVPGVSVKQEGEHPLGSGPELSIGSYVHRGVLEALRDVARQEEIPVTVGIAPRRTATDADFLAKVRAGVPSAVVSVPCRYMHSPNEAIDPSDVEATIRLLTAFAAALPQRHPLQQP